LIANVCSFVLPQDMVAGNELDIKQTAMEQATGIDSSIELRKLETRMLNTVAFAEEVS
jgi:hypothetical protein